MPEEVPITEQVTTPDRNLWVERLARELPATFLISQGSEGLQLKLINYLFIKYSIPLDLTSNLLSKNRTPKSIDKYINNRNIQSLS